MAKATYIYATHWHSVTKRALLLSNLPSRQHGTQHKWHRTTTLLVFWSTTNTLLIWIIEPFPTTIRHRRAPRISFWSDKISTLKSNDHESKLYNKFKNSLIKSLSSVLGKYNLWAFFHKVYHFCKAPCFVGVIFVYFRWSICHVPFS